MTVFSAADLVAQEQAARAPAASPSGDVVERLLSGERQALGELYDAHAPLLGRFSRMLIGDSAAAEDLVHDVRTLGARRRALRVRLRCRGRST
jgi:DNA-directed RNA polymerase specialized sigma24 family protein